MAGTYKCNPELDVANSITAEIMIAKVPPNPAPVGKAGSIDDGYALALQALPSADNVSKYAAGAHGTVNTKVDTGASLDALAVDLIGMTTERLFPVKRAVETPTACTDKVGKCQGDYNCRFADTLDATANDQAAMKNSLAFYQLLIADPGTKNAQALTAILNSVKSGTTDPLALPAKVDAFFKALDDPYNKCTFESFATVISYVENYAPVWANLADSYSYTVYTPSDPVGTKPAWNKIGTLTFKKSRTASLSDHNAGYDIAYVDTSNTSLPLVMKGGQFVSKASPDLSTIQLTGTFKIKSDYTLDPKDAVIIPVLIGSIGNIKVMAVALDVPSDGSSTPWYDLVNSWWAKEMMAVLAMIAAVAAFVLLIYKVCKWIKSKTKEGQSEEEREQLKEDVLDALADSIVDKRSAFKKAGLDAEIPATFDDFTNGVKALKAKALDANAIRQKQLFEEQAVKYREAIKELSELGITNDLRDAQGNLIEARTKIAAIEDWVSLQTVQKELTGKMSDCAQSLSQDFEAKANDMGEQLKQRIEATRQAAVELAKGLGEATKDGERIEEGKEPVVEDL